VVLVETELWPELLAACGARGIPVALVNARVSDKSFRGYRAIRWILRPLLGPITLALAQTEQDAARLVEIGVPSARVRVTGNVKFDASPPGRRRTRWTSCARWPAAGGCSLRARRCPGGRGGHRCGAAGPGGRRPFLLLAPRHPERAPAVMQVVAARGLSVTRRTLLAEAPPGCEVVVLDTVGELAALFKLADVAFIGGSLVATGGHNPIEPARFGVPVLTGPNVRNFGAVYRDFITARAARVVHSSAELAAALEHWLADPDAARAAGKAGLELLSRNARRHRADGGCAGSVSSHEGVARLAARLHRLHGSGQRGRLRRLPAGRAEERGARRFR